MQKSCQIEGGFWNLRLIKMASRGFRGAIKFNRNESQNDRSLEPESDQVLENGAGLDGDRNVLVENDHLQLQSEI